MKFTYLLIDLFSLLFPLIFSFHPRLKLYKHWPALLPSILIITLPFVGWDMYFTQQKAWGFNPTYVTGYYIGNLPVEEIMFFICIPYACVFTYTSIPLKGFSQKTSTWISNFIIVGAVVLAALFYQQIYTVCTLTLLATITVITKLLRLSWLPRFYQTYLILLVPFFIVNGLLTGTGLNASVVWYNPSEIMGLRLLTIPVEDIFYGMILVMLNILLYNKLLESCYRWRKSRSKRYLANA
jgi:lycopene cyclase domain-containing protein